LGSATKLCELLSPSYFLAGGDTSLIGLLLYLIEMIPLLKRGAGPLLSSLPREVSLLNAILLITASRDGFDCLGDFFAISDVVSLPPAGDAWRDDA